MTIHKVAILGDNEELSIFTAVPQTQQLYEYDGKKGCSFYEFYHYEFYTFYDKVFNTFYNKHDNILYVL